MDNNRDELNDGGGDQRKEEEMKIFPSQLSGHVIGFKQPIDQLQVIQQARQL